jgi:hypothetical protein
MDVRGLSAELMVVALDVVIVGLDKAVGEPNPAAKVAGTPVPAPKVAFEVLVEGMLMLMFVTEDVLDPLRMPPLTFGGEAATESKPAKMSSLPVKSSENDMM